MAWVRPKPKPKQDHTERNRSLLQYFSGAPVPPQTLKTSEIQDHRPVTAGLCANLAASRSPSPTKPKPQMDRQMKHSEPAVVIVDQEPEFDYEEEYEPVRARPPRRVERHVNLERSEPRRQAVKALPPPKTLPRQVPKRPERRPKDLREALHDPWEERSAMSSRWASAVTPLF